MIGNIDKGENSILGKIKWHFLLKPPMNLPVVKIVFFFLFSLDADMSAISVLWTIVSLVLLLTCSLALFSPFWHEYIPDPMSTNNSESFISFGLLRFCLQ